MTPPVWYEVTALDDPGTVLGYVQVEYLDTAHRLAATLWGQGREYALRPVPCPPGWRRRGR